MAKTDGSLELLTDKNSVLVLVDYQPTMFKSVASGDKVRIKKAAICATMGVVHSQDNIVHVDLDGNILSNTTHFVDDEFLNGSGQIFTLAHAPNPPNSLKLYRNGVLQTEGPENNYILSGDSIILVTAKDKWDQFVASYRY